MQLNSVCQINKGRRKIVWFTVISQREYVWKKPNTMFQILSRFHKFTKS